MDLAIVGTRGIPAHYGGYETFADELSTRLADKGYEVCVTCEGSSRSKQYHKVSLIYIPIMTFLLPRNLAEIIHDIFAISYVSIFIRPKVLYLLGYAACYTCVLPRLLGINVWINADGLEWKRRKFGKFGRSLLKFLELIAARLANNVIADSKEIQTYLEEEYDIIPHYISYGAYIKENCSADSVAKLGLEAGNYFLVVARIEPENNIDVIIEGFEISDTQKNLVIIGNVPDNTYGKKLLSGASDRVIFMGGLYDQEILRAVRFYCYAYIHGHEVGGTNPSLLEALASGNAVIAKDVNFNREVAGLAAKYFTDSANLAEIITRLEQNPNDLSLMKKEAPQRILDNGYTWPQVTDKYERLIKRCQSENCFY